MNLLVKGAGFRWAFCGVNRVCAVWSDDPAHVSIRRLQPARKRS